MKLDDAIKAVRNACEQQAKLSDYDPQSVVLKRDALDRILEAALLWVQEEAFARGPDSRNSLRRRIAIALISSGVVPADLVGLTEKLIAPMRAAGWLEWERASEVGTEEDESERPG